MKKRGSMQWVPKEVKLHLDSVMRQENIKKRSNAYKLTIEDAIIGREIRYTMERFGLAKKKRR